LIAQFVAYPILAPIGQAVISVSGHKEVKDGIGHSYTVNFLSREGAHFRSFIFTSMANTNAHDAFANLKISTKRFLQPTSFADSKAQRSIPLVHIPIAPSKEDEWLSQHRAWRSFSSLIFPSVLCAILRHLLLMRTGERRS